MPGRGRLRKVLIGFSFFLLVFSCSLLPFSDDPLEITVKGTHFSLEWDDDSWLVHDNPEKPAAYRVYYRNHGGSSWKALREIVASAGTTNLRVANTELEYGRYDFGVSALDGSGVESEIHSSLDTTANPVCGWYINWIGSQ